MDTKNQTVSDSQVRLIYGGSVAVALICAGLLWFMMPPQPTEAAAQPNPTTVPLPSTVEPFNDFSWEKIAAPNLVVFADWQLGRTPEGGHREGTVRFEGGSLSGSAKKLVALLDASRLKGESPTDLEVRAVVINSDAVPLHTVWQATFPDGKFVWPPPGTPKALLVHVPSSRPDRWIALAVARYGWQRVVLESAQHTLILPTDIPARLLEDLLVVEEDPFDDAKPVFLRRFKPDGREVP